MIADATTMVPLDCVRIDGSRYRVRTIAGVEDHANNLAFEQRWGREEHLAALYLGWKQQSGHLHAALRRIVIERQAVEYAAGWVARWLEDIEHDR